MNKLLRNVPLPTHNSYTRRRCWESSTCNNNQGVSSNNVEALFSHFGYNLTSVNITDECGMVRALQNGGRAILDIMPTHMALVYGIHRDEKGKITIDYFDTNDADGNWDKTGVNFNYYNQGGGDYVL